MAEQLEAQAQAILEAIRNRRTLPWTKMKPDPIKPHHLEALLEAANWAPSHKHTEPWRFYLFQGAGRQKLAGLLAETYKATCGEAFKEKKYEKTLTRPVSVPLTAAIIMRPSENPVMPDFEEILAMGCAVQNLHILARSLGIGASWSTPAYLDHPNIRNFFELGSRDRCLGFYYMGYGACEWPVSKRGDIAQKVVYINE